MTGGKTKIRFILLILGSSNSFLSSSSAVAFQQCHGFLSQPAASVNLLRGSITTTWKSNPCEALKRRSYLLSTVPYSTRYSSLSLQAVKGPNNNNNNNNQDDGTNGPSIINNNKIYNLAKWSFAIVSMTLFLIPDKTFMRQLSTKWSGAGGFGIAAFVFHLLQQHHQSSEGGITTTMMMVEGDGNTIISNSSSSSSLEEDEYANFVKRSQLGLAGFCALGLFSIPGEAAFWPTPIPALITCGLITVARIGGLIVSLTGRQRYWQHHTSNVTKNVWYGGLLDTFHGLKVQDKKKSLFYRNTALIMALGMISNFLEGIFRFRYREDLEISLFSASMSASAVARLFLVSNLLYSLKLASESDQFPKKVFWELNWTLAIWAGVVGLGQCLSYPFQFSIKRAEMLTLSVLLFLKGYKVYKQEKERVIE